MSDQVKPNAIEFHHVTFGYTTKVTNLNDVTFSIKENEYVCIVGHNGSGKSTLSKVLMGLLQPRSGYIKLFDQEITKTNLKYLRDNIGIVFQNPDNQFIGLTVEDDIAFGLENRKVDPSRMYDIINDVAKIVNVQDLLTMEASRLSGGQKQRVAIASVLAVNPKIIIFDESTSMLDPKAKQDLKTLMLNLKNEFNKTVISITHDMEEVVNADRVIILKGGQLVKTGTPVETFEDPVFLKGLSLDVPFTLHLAQALNENKVKVSPTINFNKLLEEICANK
jgi:energy-coupling factor transport system ATP-binding protein